MSGMPFYDEHDHPEIDSYIRELRMKYDLRRMFNKLKIEDIEQ